MFTTRHFLLYKCFSNERQILGESSLGVAATFVRNVKCLQILTSALPALQYHQDDLSRVFTVVTRLTCYLAAGDAAVNRKQACRRYFSCERKGVSKAFYAS